MTNRTLKHLPCVSLGTIETHIRVYAQFSEPKYVSKRQLRARLKKTNWDVINNVGGFLSKIGVLQEGEKIEGSFSRRLTETGRGLATMLGQSKDDIEDEVTYKLYWRYIVLSDDNMRYWLTLLDEQLIDKKPLETLFLDHLSPVNATASAKLAYAIFDVADLAKEREHRYRCDSRFWDHEPELERVKKLIEKHKDQRPKPAWNVHYIGEDQLRTARKKLAQIMNDLSGEVKICDQYYGVGTLEILEMIPPDCTVQFLTAKTNDKQTKLADEIANFRRTYRNTELRLFPDRDVLHDRYIISDDSLLLLGKGIKDFGYQESFVVVIPAEFAGDLIETIRKVFDERWKRSTPLGAGAN